MWTQKIEYIDVVEDTAPRIIKKQVWDKDNNAFVPMTLARSKGIPTSDQIQWLKESFGWPGNYTKGNFWDYSIAGDYTIMDEKLYAWYQLKWSNE